MDPNDPNLVLKIMYISVIETSKISSKLNVIPPEIDRDCEILRFMDIFATNKYYSLFDIFDSILQRMKTYGGQCKINWKKFEIQGIFPVR